MMVDARLAHVAYWTSNLETVAEFWAKFFGAEIGEQYQSQNRPGFHSRFVTLRGSATIELMTGPWIHQQGMQASIAEEVGLAHIAIGLGSPSAVDGLYRELDKEGRAMKPPRWTGDGFYEAIVSDPDGNLIEITA